MSVYAVYRRFSLYSLGKVVIYYELNQAITNA